MDQSIWSKQPASPFQSELEGVIPCPYEVRPPAKGRSVSVHLQRHLFGLLDKTSIIPKSKPASKSQEESSMLTSFVIAMESAESLSYFSHWLQLHSLGTVEKNKDIKNNEDRYWSPIHTSLCWLTASSNQKGQSYPERLQALTETGA